VLTTCKKEMEKANKAECLTRSSSSDMWRKIWKTHVPNVKNFLWKACHDILPTHDNLYRRKVIEDLACLIYRIEAETAFHILRQCLSAMDVWCEGVRKFQKSSFKGPKFILVVAGMFNLCDGEEMRMFVGVVRRIWLRRNEIVHRGSFSSPKKILLCTQGALLDYQLAHEKRVLSGALNMPVQRLTLPDGWVLVNWDATLNKDKG
jgi:hypothetical protein